MIKGVIRTGVVVFGLMNLFVNPVFADEFKVGIVTLDRDGIDGSAFMEGFQLAVDQSPDVSHPAGIEGGDHLGGMDVSFRVIDGNVTQAEISTTIVNLVEQEEVSIVVFDGRSEVLESLFDPIVTSETMLIAMSDVSELNVPPTPYFFAASEQAGLLSLLTDTNPSFTEAFVSEYGNAPTDAATRGYLAGRLIDMSVAATNQNPADIQSLAKGLTEAVSSPAPNNDSEIQIIENSDENLVKNQSEANEESNMISKLVFVIISITIFGYILFRRLQKNK